jgi:hypothetical protein
MTRASTSCDAGCATLDISTLAWTGSCSHRLAPRARRRYRVAGQYSHRHVGRTVARPRRLRRARHSSAQPDHRIRDAVVVALYLGVLFGIGVTTAAAVASMVVLWVAKGAGSTLARRGRALSFAAGIAIGLLCLIYLTLWWQTLIAGLGRSAPLWSAAALAVAAAISVLLAHAVMVTASAVIVAAAKGSLETPAVASTPRWMVVLAGIVGFGGAALLTISAGRAVRLSRRRADRCRAACAFGLSPSTGSTRSFDELASAGRLPR